MFFSQREEKSVQLLTEERRGYGKRRKERREGKRREVERRNQCLLPCLLQTTYSISPYSNSNHIEF